MRYSLLLHKLLPRPYIVVGMHRSGTSFLSQVLISANVFMGKYLDNNYESKVFLKFNEKILKENQITWDEIASVNTFPEFKFRLILGHFFKNNKLNGFKNLLNITFKKDAWGWKDPRNTITLQYWLNIFPNAKIIFIYRNGYDVAKSLVKRNNKLKESNRYYSSRLNKLRAAFELWEDYNNYFLQIANDIPKSNLLFLRYEKIIALDKTELKNIDEFTLKNISTIIKEKADPIKALKKPKEKYPSYVIDSPLMKKLNYI